MYNNLASTYVATPIPCLGLPCEIIILRQGTLWGESTHEARHHPLYAVDHIASLWAFRAVHALCTESIIR